MSPTIFWEYTVSGPHGDLYELHELCGAGKAGFEKQYDPEVLVFDSFAELSFFNDRRPDRFIAGLQARFPTLGFTLVAASDIDREEVDASLNDEEISNLEDQA